MFSAPSSRHLAAAIVAVAAVLSLGACTSGAGPAAPATDATAAPIPEQPVIAGEWVVTRTVVSSDDTGNPARAVGAESVRYLSVVREDCGEPLCPGTVSSGSTPESREATGFTQVDGGLEYELTGALDCLNTTTGAVLAVDAFEFTQTATLTVAETTEIAGVATATSLTGSIGYTDTLTAQAAAVGCARTPATVNVEYSITAARPA